MQAKSLESYRGWHSKRRLWTRPERPDELAKCPMCNSDSASEKSVQHLEGHYCNASEEIRSGRPSKRQQTSIPQLLIAGRRHSECLAESGSFAMSNIVLRRGEVMRRVGLKASAFDELRKRDDFPKSTIITGRTPAWLEHEVDSWIAQRFAERDRRVS